MKYKLSKYYFCILYILVIAFIIIRWFFWANKQKEGFEKGDKIPKIIHQTAPADKSKWRPEWVECQKTWHTFFPSPEYTYMMWTDEDLDNLIKTDFPEFYQNYKNYNKNIKRFDIARYFILYKYGGIYADMDYKCFKNFYTMIPINKVSISESPFENEYVQNALMMSSVNHPFWMKVIEKAKTRLNADDILYQTGPRLVSDTCDENKNMVNILSIRLWNPQKDEPDNPDMITRHLCTAVWV
jgi:mannosyltransferase OCH1-like enzyme